MTARPPTAGCLVAVLLAAGCAWTPKPYARDPLVRHGKAQRADPRGIVPPAPPPDPQPPLPPDPGPGPENPVASRLTSSR